MFYSKRIKDLEERLKALEERTARLSHRVQEQSEEINKLYALVVNKTDEPAQKPKPRPRYRKKTNGKEVSKSE